jgi:ParB-like chromosome segregation protein Spo0J
MKVETVSIESIVPYANNPRNNEEAIEKVARSIDEFGWQQPIVVDENMVIIVGHTRLLAAKSLGLNEVPIHVADKLTDEQARAYRLADNRTNEYASWNMKMLGIELRDLDDIGFDIELTGFNNIELASLLIDPEVIEDHSAEWQGMPEYESENVAYKSLVVHFLKAQDVNDFSQLIGQAIGDRTKYLWFPPVEKEDAKSKEYR